MKLSSFTKYLSLRVINTEVPWLVAVMAAFILLTVQPVAAQNGSKQTPVNAGQAARVRGDAAAVPEDHFRVLGEAVALRQKADSVALVAGRLAKEAVNAPPADKDRFEKRGAAENAKAEALTARADSLLLTPVRIEDYARKTMSGSSPATPQEVQHLSQFEVRRSPAYSDTNPVPFDPVLPEGLIYSVQIAAFKNNVATSLFKGLYPIFGRKRQGSDAVYYYAGMFRRMDDARKALPEARGAGFPDAFIIAMMNGVQVSAERAALLEKEWGTRPLTASGATAALSLPDQPVPVGTLYFRAEVMRIDKPVKPEVIQKIEQLAGTRGLEAIKNNIGETVFLIGNFITFESAAEYVSLLARNGYSSARVAAYVGQQEIPVDAAKELINKLPDD